MNDYLRQEKIRQDPIYKRAYSMCYIARYRAKRDHLEFELTPEWFYNKLKGKCEVTNLNFYLSRHALKKGEKHNLSPSVDRIDNSKGYSLNNSRVVIWWFNMAKGVMSDFDLWHWCELTVRSLEEKGVLNAKSMGETPLKIT